MRKKIGTIVLFLAIMPFSWGFGVACSFTCEGDSLKIMVSAVKTYWDIKGSLLEIDRDIKDLFVRVKHHSSYREVSRMTVCLSDFLARGLRVEGPPSAKISPKKNYYVLYLFEKKEDREIPVSIKDTFFCTAQPTAESVQPYLLVWYWHTGSSCVQSCVVCASCVALVGLVSLVACDAYHRNSQKIEGLLKKVRGYGFSGDYNYINFCKTLDEQNCKNGKGEESYANAQQDYRDSQLLLRKNSYGAKRLLQELIAKIKFLNALKDSSDENTKKYFAQLLLWHWGELRSSPDFQELGIDWIGDSSTKVPQIKVPDSDTKITVWDKISLLYRFSDL